MKGTWQTTGGGGDAAGPVTAVVGLTLAGALAYEALQGAARALGEIAVVAVVAVVALTAGAGVTLLVMWLRGRRRAAIQPARQPRYWRVNPQAVPAQPVRALPPSAPVINVTIDPALLAGLMNAAHQQAAPVIITPAREEVQP
jgi:hypothetical protein